MTLLLNIARFAVAILLGWFVLTSVLVVGWAARLARRSALKAMIRERIRGDWRVAAAENEKTAMVAAWPGWIMGPRGAVGWRRWIGGLWENLRLGLAVFLPTLLVTVPAGALWLLSWWGGWNNSFGKGYEQAWVGPAVAAVGFILWLAVATLVPLAQARVAITGDWRTFFGIGVLRRVLARRRWAVFALSVCAVAGALWFLFIRALPALVVQNAIVDVHLMSPAEVRKLHGALYLSTGAVMLVLFLWFRLWAARVYASGMMRALDAGTLSPDALHIEEQAWVKAVENLSPGIETAAPAPVRRSRLLRGANATAAAPLTLLAWVAVAALLYVAQFMLYAPVNWLIHPMIHLPWIRVFGIV